MAPSPQIHVERFEQMIARRGRMVRWEQAILCSCWNIDSEQPDYRCLACGGRGYTYENPIEEIGLLQSVTHNKEFEEMAGIFDIGDAVLTVPKRVFVERIPPENRSGIGVLVYDHDSPMYDIGMYDLVTLLDDEYKTSELLIRGEDIYGRPADTLLNGDITGIVAIRKNDPETGVSIQYEEGTDFVMDGKRVDWIGANQPELGERYSVTYRHLPVFTVLTTLPKPRYQDKQLLPRYVALRYRAGGFEPK